MLIRYGLSPLTCLASITFLIWILGWRPVAVATSILVTGSFSLRYFTSQMQKGMMLYMQRKDTRTNIVLETLGKIKSIKLYGWQPISEAILEKARTDELSALAKLGSIQAWMLGVMNEVPELMLTGAILCHMFYGGNLDSQTIFPALGFFVMLKSAMSQLSSTLHSVTMCIVSFPRVEEYLLLPEQDNFDNLIVQATSNERRLRIAYATFGYPTKTIASDLNLNIEAPCLAVLIGPTGSGKSTVLETAMGYLSPLEGLVDVKGCIAYVPQVPWLMTGTIRENILFGTPFKPEYYSRVLSACCLDVDLSLLPEGDCTPLGGAGIALSGGQKSRICLARAVYSEADIVLMDDPLAALDSKVKNEIIGHLFGSNGLLSQSICLTASNCQPLIRAADLQCDIVDRKIRISHTKPASTKNPDDHASIRLEPPEESSEDRSPSPRPNKLATTVNVSVSDIVEDTEHYADSNLEAGAKEAEKHRTSNANWHAYRTWLGAAKFPAGYASWSSQLQGKSSVLGQRTA